MKNELKDKIIECKDCKEQFIFPAKISEKDLSQNLDEEKAREVLKERDLLQEKIKSLTDSGQISDAQNLQREFNNLEDMIIKLSNGNSQEAYDFRGFTHEPARCPECRRKEKAMRVPANRETISRTR